MYPQLWCPDQHYSVYGQLFMQPIDVSVRSLFTFDATHNHTNVFNTADQFAGSTPSSIDSAAVGTAAEMDVFHTEALAAYCVFVWAMLLLSYGISAPTGIFIPCLAAGAAAGRLAGHTIKGALRSAGIMLPVRNLSKRSLLKLGSGVNLGVSYALCSCDRA